MPNEVLLLEDVDSFGRSGDIVTVKPGFARNFLFPKKKAVIVDDNTRRMQARLQEERLKQAAIDLKTSQAKAAQLEGVSLVINVKVDPEGHMYGSVSATDIVKLFAEKGIELKKNVIDLAHPIKTVGIKTIYAKFKENVEASFKLKVIPEGSKEADFDEQLLKKAEEEEAKAKEEEAKAKEEEAKAKAKEEESKEEASEEAAE